MPDSARRLKLLVITLLLLIAPGCRKTAEDDVEAAYNTKWNVTLEKDDKKPYGSYLSYESLKYFFPEAKVTPLPTGFRFTSMNSELNDHGEGQNVMILLGLHCYVSALEWRNLKSFVFDGNDLVIFCSTLDDKIEADLREVKTSSSAYYMDEMMPYSPDNPPNDSVLEIANAPGRKFGYKGRCLRGYFEPDTLISSGTPEPATADSNAAVDSDALVTEEVYDSTEYIFGPDTIGASTRLPNIVRYSYGRGHIILHAAPLAMSNYFLLQRRNIDYLTALWSYLPSNVENIYWSDFHSRSSENSSLDILWAFPATRLALTLAVVVLALYVLFQLKRRQRIIPVIAPLKNESVTFVETVGRLYFNKGNHQNLSSKMIQQFLEWVRTHYYLNTNVLNDDFVRQLTMKSGMPEATVRETVNMIHEVRLAHSSINDAYLYQLHRSIQTFYKNRQR